MKKMILLATTLISQLAMATETTQFQCVNNMFREARLHIEDQQVLIEDSYVGGSDQLEAAVAERLGLKGKVHIKQTVLVIPKKEANCSQPFGLLVGCDGQATQGAYLHIQGFADHGSDISGNISLTLPAQVKKFSLNTHLSSSGPVDLSGRSTVVPLNNLVTNATADVTVLGKDITLTWSVFFLTTENTNGSSCRKF